MTNSKITKLKFFNTASPTSSPAIPTFTPYVPTKLGCLKFSNPVGSRVVTVVKDIHKDTSFIAPPCGYLHLMGGKLANKPAKISKISVLRGGGYLTVTLLNYNIK